MKNFAELDAKICSCTDALTAKLEGTNGKRAILLCGGKVNNVGLVEIPLAPHWGS